MKKFLSLFMAMFFMFCNLFYSTPPIFAHKLSKDDVIEDCVVLQKNQSSLDNNGIKNVLDHPFKILFRAGGWGILGALSSIILPIPQGVCCLLGIIFGGASKVIELYEEGCGLI